MKFTLTVQCDGAAFEGENLGPELARILEYEAGYLKDGAPDVGYNTLRDINGNRCGRVSLAEEKKRVKK